MNLNQTNEKCCTTPVLVIFQNTKMFLPFITSLSRNTVDIITIKTLGKRKLLVNRLQDRVKGFFLNKLLFPNWL